jgi:hypothetical protein
VGAYPSAERTYKPFNPILGETFELRKGDMRYVSEQARASCNAWQCAALTPLLR